ncbi:uncharacterized protein N7529_010023 [Penicillium soppii]|uniref:uncharacterized protein n=1 Tax=Penicillium soppii TaxID=69789 RepID=UPI002548032E|nr:uncharacterized protein N7529_010023 [Penicillium soppii]KAJ5856079.1 hypothetical protein N7529_010023 [Penicillium soppii]
MLRAKGEFIGGRPKLPSESRTIGQYSNSQLTKLRRASYKDYGFDFVKQQVAKCAPCANSQIVELKCYKCGHILDISQFSKNQRIREEPLCQPCMNYQQSLDAGGKPPSLEPPEEEDEDITDLQSLTEDVGLTLQESDVFDIDTALVQFQRSGCLVASSDEIYKRKSLFDKVKAHRASPTPVDEPTPAPGWTSDGINVNDGTPWKGYKYI